MKPRRRIPTGIIDSPRSATCAETGQTIRRGERCLITRGPRFYHIASPTARRIVSNRSDLDQAA